MVVNHVDVNVHLTVNRTLGIVPDGVVTVNQTVKTVPSVDVRHSGRKFDPGRV